ncbi:hypothetical protein K438DRAFT_1630147 [Mycena galopus ATCC 62051]|nr:hypothetical protein K438DRAFT_1630147 [Mycena galopus ATCC 62051]
MTFRSPNWGTEPLPQAPRSASPHHREFAKAQSPPRLLMPDAAGDGNNAGGLAPPTINAPEGDGLGPRLHIVPATPVSGGGAAGPQAVPFQTSLETLHQGERPPHLSDVTQR